MNSMIFGRSLLLNKFLRLLRKESVPIEIIDVDGKRYTSLDGHIRHQLLIKDNKFFKALISPDAFALGEAYVKGYFDVTGNLRDLYEQVGARLLNKIQRKKRTDFFSHLLQNSKNREKKNIEYHYNIPADFYRLFLGKTMGYTCGYYDRDDATMDEAQIQKMDIICRKLRLKRGEQLLDIGCGWGNLVIHAAKRYGAKVCGITLSEEQKRYAERWIEKEGVSGQAKIVILNYRDLDNQSFDKISCVGMSEHVGRINMPRFFKVVYNALKPRGLFLQHTITTNAKRKKGFQNRFLDQYMFPGGELMREDELINIAGETGFDLIHAENFRPHYINTLNDWIIRMETHKEQMLKIISETVFRIYHVFFIGSLISFRKKEISLFQNLFYKTDDTHFSLTPFNSLYSNYDHTAS